MESQNHDSPYIDKTKLLEIYNLSEPQNKALNHRANIFSILLSKLFQVQTKHCFFFPKQNVCTTPSKIQM